MRLVLVLAAIHPWNTLAQNAPPAPNAAKVDAQDKINKLSNAVSNSTPALNLANNYAAELKSLTDPSSDKGDIIGRVQAIDAMLKTIVNSKLLDLLADTAITKAKAELPSCDKATLGDDDVVT